MKNIQNKNNTGFTLIETLVAISIFTMSLVALIVVLGSSIANTDYTKAKNISAYLAQEGIESVRNMRDTFLLFSADKGYQWGDFENALSSCVTGGNGCYFSNEQLNYTVHTAQMTTNQAIFNCGSSCPPLLYDTNTGKYGYVSGTNSGYVRIIHADPIASGQLKISSTVSWKQGTNTYNITFSEVLFNWIE